MSLVELSEELMAATKTLAELSDKLNKEWSEVKNLIFLIKIESLEVVMFPINQWLLFAEVRVVTKTPVQLLDKVTLNMTKVESLDLVTHSNSMELLWEKEVEDTKTTAELSDREIPVKIQIELSDQMTHINNPAGTW